VTIARGAPERNFSLSFLISSTGEITRQRKIPLRAENSAQWKTAFRINQLAFSRRPKLAIFEVLSALLKVVTVNLPTPRKNVLFPTGWSVVTYALFTSI
jgi:hypothetical protein